MSIKLHTLVKDGLGTVAKIIVIDTAESYKAFQGLIQNGSGLYPDLSAEVKTFADEVTVGRAMQEYKDDRKPLTADVIEAAFEEPIALQKYCTYCDAKVREQDVVCHNCLHPL